jgi:hypothetical protein
MAKKKKGKGLFGGIVVELHSEKSKGLFGGKVLGAKPKRKAKKK